MTIAILRITIRLTRDVSDPYILFRVRDGFKGAFRRVAGCRGGECDRCVRSDECPYWIVFAQELSADPAALKRHQKPPLPFAFSFPVFPSSPNAGLALDVRLVLIGAATRFVSEFVEAVKLLCARHDEKGELAVVEWVESLGYHGEPSLIYVVGQSAEIHDSLTLLTADGLRDTRLLDFSGTVRLRLLTPLKLLQDGRPTRIFSFSHFMRTLIRRISALASYYCDDTISADFRWLSSLCETVSVSSCSIRWVEWGGGRQGGKLAGLTGEAVLAGVPEEFITFLLLGEVLNVGKGAAFGLGCFSVAAEGS